MKSKDGVIEDTDNYIICRTPNDFKIIDKYFENLGYIRNYDFDGYYNLMVYKKYYLMFAYDTIIKVTSCNNIICDDEPYFIEAKKFLRKIKFNKING